MTPTPVGMTVAESIRSALSVLYLPGDVTELRIFKAPKGLIPDHFRGTVAGYYDDMDALASRAADLDRNPGVQGIYVTLNPGNPALLARGANRVMTADENGLTADSHTHCRRWLLVDLDAERPTGISSSDSEHQAAIARAGEVRNWLTGQGWPAPVEADSGNGAHLLCRLDLPNDPPSLDLVKRCLEALAARFAADGVKVDLKVFNAARITKLYGTMTRKGDNLPVRPHRRSHLTHIPSLLEPVALDLLKALAAQAPAAAKPVTRAQGTATAAAPIDVKQLLADHGIEVKRTGTTHDGASKWILKTCVWNSDHTDASAWVLQFPSGAADAGCSHDSCSSKHWQEFKDAIGVQRRTPSTKNGASTLHAVPTPPSASVPSPDADALIASIQTSPPSAYSAQVLDWAGRADPEVMESFSFRLRGISGLVVKDWRAEVKRRAKAAKQSAITADSQQCDFVVDRVTRTSTVHRKYTLYIEDTKLVMDVGTLIAKQRFKEVFVEHLNRIPILPKDWETQVNAWLAASEEIESAPESSVEITVKRDIIGHVESLGVSDVRADIINGKAFLVGDRRGWRTKPLLGALHADGHPLLSSSDLCDLLRELGCEEKVKRVETKSTRLWVAPSSWPDLLGEAGAAGEEDAATDDDS